MGVGLYFCSCCDETVHSDEISNYTIIFKDTGEVLEEDVYICCDCVKPYEVKEIDEDNDEDETLKLLLAKNQSITYFIKVKKELHPPQYD